MRLKEKQGGGEGSGFLPDAIDDGDEAQRRGFRQKEKQRDASDDHDILPDAIDGDNSTPRNARLRKPGRQSEGDILPDSVDGDEAEASPRRQGFRRKSKTVDEEEDPFDD